VKQLNEWFPFFSILLAEVGLFLGIVAGCFVIWRLL
jgi:hypothetical protein